ncbi:MAG: dihydrofolate reductase [Candidatus Dadabacteria bacterium]
MSDSTNKNELSQKTDTKGNKGDFVISLLVAADENNVIGKANKLPWHLPSDLRYFKNQTWGMPILMGRKTFESIGKPLPGRKSIVITRNTVWQVDGVDVVHNIEESIEKAKFYGAKEIFVIGGAEIFRTTFSHADRIYFTRIHQSFEGDVYFPVISEREWVLRKTHYCKEDEKNAFAHSFQVWERIK